MNIFNNKFTDDIRKASLLVVDDELANVRLLEKFMMTMGYTNVVRTQDPEKVISLYQEYNSDLSILDLDMPKPDW